MKKHTSILLQSLFTFLLILNSGLGFTQDKFPFQNLNINIETRFADVIHPAFIFSDNLEIPLEFDFSSQTGKTEVGFELPTGLPNFMPPNKRALITDVRHIIRDLFSYYDSDASKNVKVNYFIENEKFTNSILEKIEMLTKEKFDVSEVDYFQQKKVDCRFGSENDELNIKNIDRSGADIFISIVIFENPGLSLKFKIIVENKKGKKIFKQSIRIPIHSDSISGTYISDNKKINEIKYKQFYKSGLSAVFKKKKTKFEPQYVTRPVRKEYVDFYLQSNKFVLIRGKDNYILEDEKGEIIEPAFFILNGKGKGVKKGIKWNFGSFSSQKFKKCSFLYNNVLNADYVILTKGGKGKLLGGTNKSSPSVDFIHADTTIGHFQLKSDWYFNGDFNKINYCIIRSLKPPFYEIHDEKNLIAIIRYRPNGHYIISFLKSLTVKEQSQVINVIFAWEEAIRLSDILETK